MDHDSPTDEILESLRLPVNFSTQLPVPLVQNLSDGLWTPISIPNRIRKPEASPRDLKPQRKRLILWTGSMGPLFASFAASSYAPAKQQLAAAWGFDDVAVLTGITAFTTGFALAPMVLAPVSETWGRRPVFLLTGLLFIIRQVGCAVTTSLGGMIAARFFAGIGSSSYATIFGGVISDLYHAKERNSAMAFFSGAALFGTGLGPLVCGFVADYLSWRWIFWIQVVISVLLVALYFFFVPETREAVVLRNRTKVLQHWYDEQTRDNAVMFQTTTHEGSRLVRARCVIWTTTAEFDGETSGLAKKILLSTYRPFQFLFTEPIVFFFSLWAAFSWCILFVTLAVVPLVFMEGYGFSLSSANATFAASCAASMVAVPVSVWQEQWLDGVSHPWVHLERPERRLYFSCVQSLLLPMGLFMFGWTAEASAHWILPTVAVGLAAAGIFSVYLAVFNYLADTYSTYASSALAAQSFCRNALGGVLPLVTAQLFNNLGYGPASTLLGGIGLVLTLGPWMLVAYGETIRSRSQFASDKKGAGAHTERT